MEMGPGEGSIGSARDSGSGGMGGVDDGGVFYDGPLQGRERLEPVHWYIDFGLENVIREQLFRDERFLKERGNHRVNNPATGESPYQGEAYAELLQKTGGKAGRWESSLVELMFDSVQPFRKASHSSTILSVRYMDVDPRNRGKAWASAVVAVIPGPSIPKAMRAYLLRTVAALQRLAEDGMEVTQPRTIGPQHDPAFKYKHHVYFKSWRMEDWLHFVRTFAPFIFRGVLRGTAQVMWQKLTDAVCHYFTPLLAADRVTFLASASAAHRRLCEFAQLAEENTFPDKTFSVNLHICCCRLLRQEQRVGAAAGDLEFAVERVMQYYKRVASGVAYKPEQHFANEVLLTGAMAEKLANQDVAQQAAAVAAQAAATQEAAAAAEQEQLSDDEDLTVDPRQRSGYGPGSSQDGADISAGTSRELAVGTVFVPATELSQLPASESEVVPATQPSQQRRSTRHRSGYGPGGSQDGADISAGTSRELAVGTVFVPATELSQLPASESEVVPATQPSQQLPVSRRARSTHALEPPPASISAPRSHRLAAGVYSRSSGAGKCGSSGTAPQHEA
ncbi:hypothetical protein HYH02_015419 [Chlamydomonas schloesseri]|uniref:Uncharacterized protein n=1 Tax=Chlamydomonas schloesseri TaxID=2026947 RepID=A0A835SM76_9CHLO|nr:hypothetical protein HYH02_015419 [Chlamydomonas schloesseri]|eukprot:KAG2422541.1 hypothetical protein HYH02_015419 [Chlamydomonas schloesseri]